jgi:uroporphyrinogen-III decarboxylase
MSAESTVAEWLRGTRIAPAYLRRYVCEYQRYATMVADLESYPRSVDTIMDTIHDTLVAVVRESTV